MQTLLLAEVNDLMKRAKKLFGLTFLSSGLLRAFGKILPRLHKKSLNLSGIYFLTGFVVAESESEFYFARMLPVY